MPAPATINEFLDVVRKSHQIDNDRLEQYLQERQQPLPGHPRKLAVELIRDGLVTNFQAEQFLQGKYKGFNLGGYRILERLGAGGAGTVYLAEHEVMKRRVAIKVLPTLCAEDPISLERFRLEARAAALLNHPNVVRFYDFRQEGPLHFIIMEYIDGPNLQQLITKRGPLAIPTACDYIRQAALGLQHAHESGLVHRDIKPANLLVDTTGTLRVLDLGLARFEISGELSVTRKFNSKIVLGTADYLSPEQALDLHTVDARADIYSLGATLYALLAGRPPFHEGSAGQKLMWHQMKEPPPLSNFRPEVPETLAALVMRMLAKQPDQRVQTMTEVIQALTPWADQTRPEMRPSAKTLLDLRNDRVATLASSGPRILPTLPAEDTLVACVGDTAPHVKKQHKVAITTPTEPVPALPQTNPASSSTSANWRLALLTGLIGLVAGLSGGALVLLLWGMRG